MPALRLVFLSAVLAGAPLTASSQELPGAPGAEPPALRPVPADIVASTRSAPIDLGFAAWIASFRGRALAAGIAPEVYDRTMRSVSFVPEIVDRDRSQPEFNRQIWDYLDRAVSPMRVLHGRAAMLKHRAVLDEIEARYGVEAEVVAAIWGLESAYGRVRGSAPILSAMASLAFDGRRARFFEDQLIAALRIVQAEDVVAEAMTGSWAGAMGHTQFMPGSYLEYAVDFDGDGRRDIWSDDPADALASTAAYLQRHGWTRGQPWGVEVTLPEGFDYAQAGSRRGRPVSHWTAQGVTLTDGGTLPDHGSASILVPAGHRGAAFAVYGNFRVLEKYNASDAYVIAVGHLADRLIGGGPFAAGWPRDDEALSFDERKTLQQRLLARGYDPRGIDGIIGPGTMAALRAYQSAEGMVPDGYATRALLEKLR